MSIAIGIDALFADPRRIFGLWNHCKALIKGLVECAPDYEFIVFLNSAARSNFGLTAKNLRVVQSEVSSRSKFIRIIAQNSWLLGQAAKYDLKLLHSPANYGPLFTRLPTVVTVHDLLPFFPETKVAKLRSSGLNLLMGQSIGSAEKVIVSSRFMAQAVHERYAVCWDRLKIIPLGIETEGLVLSPQIPIRGVEKPFLLTVGLYSPHKNIHRLIDAFWSLKKNGNFEHHLVLVGDIDEPDKAELLSRIRERQLSESVHLLGHVRAEHLTWLYAQCDLYVCASLMEGFGLPVLEAMALGAPVACSSAGPLPEVVGCAAMLFEPKSVEDMAQTMYTLLRNRSLARSLAREGAQRVQEFSAKIMAHRTLELYEEMMSVPLEVG